MAPSGAIFSVFTPLFTLLWLSVSPSHEHTETYWQAPLQLFDYRSYRSVRMLEYTLPQQTSRATWIFHGLISEEGCEERNVEIAMQRGSYPVIAPLGETFPPYFNLNRTSLHILAMRTNGTKMFFQIANPLPGSWFAALYLTDAEENKIKQKGFGKNCQYFVGSTQEVSVSENIPELLLQVHTPLEASNAINDLYRFHTTEQTWEYTLTITNCRFIPKSNNNNHNITLNTSQSDCPLQASVRGPALASWEHSEARVNCSDSWTEQGNCSLVVSSPEANAWQYLWTSTDAAGSVHFTVYVDIKECQRYGAEPRPESPQHADEPELDPVFTNTTSSNNTNTTNPNTSQSPSTVKKMIIPFPMPAGRVSGETITVLNTTDLSFSPSSPSSNIQSEPPSQQYPNLNISLTNATNTTIYDPTNPNMNTTSTGTSDFDPSSSTMLGYDIVEGDFKQCTRIPELGRFTKQAFDIQYNLRLGSLAFPNQLLIPPDEPLVLAFDVKALQDNGGTLKYTLSLLMEKINTMNTLEVVSCIRRGRIPLDQQGVACNPENQLVVRTDGYQNRRMYFPYPESGTWYITLLTRCYANRTQAVPCLRREHAVISFSLNIMACVDGGCGIYGQCREYFSGVLHFSGCACTANWRGYGCTDGSVAESDLLQLISTLLLSLSNLAFLPAIIVALVRRFYVEALVYTYTMFFSTFYHACDGDSRHTWCMMPYNVLAHCDFFGAILSFWVTLIAMAKLPERARSFLLMLAALALAVGVQWDRHSLWTFLVPAGTGLVIMLISWSYRCRKRKDCYPSKRRWLIFVLPGALIAVTGLITFAFFETDRNYKYTHSVWHICMALCVVFILPPRKLTENEDAVVENQQKYDTYETVSTLPQGTTPNQLIVYAR